jgi:hypothetical protein
MTEQRSEAVVFTKSGPIIGIRFDRENNVTAKADG